MFKGIKELYNKKNILIIKILSIYFILIVYKNGLIIHTNKQKLAYHLSSKKKFNRYK